MQLLASLAESLEYHAPYAAIRHTRLGQFLMAANRFNQTVESSQHYDETKRDFIEENYSNYKELCDYDVFALIKQLSEMDDTHAATQIAVRIQQRNMPKIVRLDHVDLHRVTAELAEFKNKHHKIYQDWQLSIIQTPHQSYSGEDDPIFVVNEVGAINPIGKFSFMINAISDKLEHIVFLSIDNMIADDEPIVAFMKHLQSEPAMA